MSVGDIGALISTLIAAMAVLLSAHELSLSRRAQEIEGVFQLWDRYERYAKEYTVSLKGSADEQRLSMVNMLTFLENSCLILNRARAPKLLKQNIRSLVNDYIDLTERVVTFSKVLDHFSMNYGNFEELRTFYDKYR